MAKRAAVAISTEGALKYSASLHSLQIDSAACTARDNHGEVLLLAHLDKPISTASGRLDLASSLKLPPNDRGYGWFELGRIDTIHCDLHGRATLLGVLSVPVANATLTFRTAHNPHEDHSLVISASLPAAPSHPVSRHIRIPSGSAFPLANLTAAAAPPAAPPAASRTAVCSTSRRKSRWVPPSPTNSSRSQRYAHRRVSSPAVTATATARRRS